MRLGPVLLKYRKAARLKQGAVAAQLGKNEDYISQLERDVREPSLSFLSELAGVYGVRASVILAEAEDLERRTI